MAFNKTTLTRKDGAYVKLAFSKQAPHFDEDDLANPILQSWRKQIYNHVDGFLRPGDRMLELNAGTGIDAVYFASRGTVVHATDVSPGMIMEIGTKSAEGVLPHLTFQQISFEQLEDLEQTHFDYVFSNFGGLNCIPDLSLVTRHFGKILNPGAYVTWVVMPPFCPWEFLWLLKGKWREATRRFRTGGTMAHVEGEWFQTYYHSLGAMKGALGKSFELVRSEGLGVFSAPPSATSFYRQHATSYRIMRKMDLAVKDYFPFSLMGDHIIATFKKS